VKTTIKVIAFIALLAIASKNFEPQAVFAQDDQGGGESMSVVASDQPIRFALKRISEKIRGFWIQSTNPSGIGEFRIELAKERSLEMFYILERQELEAHMETSVSRYITYMGILTEQLDQDGVEGKSVVEAFSGQVKSLESQRDRFPAQSAQWLMMQQCIDTVNVLLSKASENG